MTVCGGRWPFLRRSLASGAKGVVWSRGGSACLFAAAVGPKAAVQVRGGGRVLRRSLGRGAERFPVGLSRDVQSCTDMPGKPRCVCKSKQGAVTAGSARERGLGAACMSTAGGRGKGKGRGLACNGSTGFSRRPPARAEIRCREVGVAKDLQRAGEHDSMGRVGAGTTLGGL
ncbi:hypothetical protein NDU88_006879 [Pleurodeles waltl]|uniref:Uncharacterized protein n=1 Tax=Pleurodeles waltl TaxID=8319 RepID=A0AAV7PMC2_PLEWA|nr:hypothetical protein NDU88_006879 [Pleurodeles waltl]